MNKKIKKMMEKIMAAAFYPLLFTLGALLLLPVSLFSAGDLFVDGTLGVQTTNPLSQFHVVSESTSNFRGMVSSQHSTDKVTAVMAFYKSRGTEDAPTTVVDDDTLGWFNVKGYDGTSYVAPASFGFRVDGPVSTDNVPTAFIVLTGFKQGVTGRLERFRINSVGDVTINNLEGTYTGGSAYVCVDDGGKIFASEVACP